MAARRSAYREASARPVRDRASAHASLATPQLFRVGVCAIALIPIVALYYQSWRLPSSLVALGVALVATVLTWALLGPTGESRGRIAVYALCTGLVVGEVAWALGAWPVPPLAEAATAWLATYVLAGISEHAALEHLDRMLLREYLLVGLVGSLAVMIGTWRFG